MNEDIARMAREAGLLPEKSNIVYQHSMYEFFIERFAVLVRADEREACAKLFDDRDNRIGFYEPHEPAEIIRARGRK